MTLRKSTVSVVVLAIASTALAQPAGPRGGGFGRGFGATRIALVGAPEVRQEIATTEEQNGKLDLLQSQHRQEMRSAFEGFGAGGDRRQAFEKVTALNKSFDEKLAAMLKPEQIERLDQLVLQRLGPGALLRPETAESLGLSPQQRQEIQAVFVAARPDQSSLATFQNLSEQERRELFAEMRAKREQAEADALAVLDSEQTQKWDAMQGEPFEFTSGFGRFRGRRPGQ